MAPVVQTDGLTKDFTDGVLASAPASGAGWPDARDSRRRRVRPAGAQRRGQEHDAQAAAESAAADVRAAPRSSGCPPATSGARQRLGFLPENPTFYDHLTAEETPQLFRGPVRLPRRDRRRRRHGSLDLVGLGADRRRPMRQYSKGMVQRVGLAQALVNDPELVILDEPMSGLDPIGRRDVRDLILRLRDEGRTVLFSSHILSDAELLCSRVGILAKGRLVASGTLTS